jgi:hypothetical protein
VFRPVSVFRHGNHAQSEAAAWLEVWLIKKLAELVKKSSKSPATGFSTWSIWNQMPAQAQ